MNKVNSVYLFKVLVWFLAGGLFLASLVGGSLVSTLTQEERQLAQESRTRANKTLADLDRLGLMDGLSAETMADLLEYQWQNKKSLSDILKEPEWAKRLGLSTDEYRVTWYMSNPFQLLPSGLQEMIRKRPTTFRSRTHVWQWCRANNIPKTYRRALYTALIETTPANLWRASRGKRPYAFNGEYLEPIVVDHGQGRLEVRNGHIATDPRFIPTNSEVLLLVKIKGEDKILKVKATDIGGAIKGKHVDLPIHLHPQARRMPNTVLPLEIRNPSVTILTRKT
jgi:3D domain